LELIVMSDQPVPAAPHADHEEGHPHVNYWAIFGVLCVLTLVSWIADELGHKGWALTLIVLAVASAKAMFVMMYFMHLKFEGKWKFVLLAPTTVLALAIPAALMPDIGSHYYDYQVPQLEDDGYDPGHAHPPAHAPHGQAEAAPKHD
jgi:cytochrome c oxidase subunit IV